MKKTIRILLCVMFAAILSAACVGCGEPAKKSFEIVGAKDLSFVQGTVTDEKLLEGVSAVFDDETTAAVTLVKGEDDDLNQPGSYEITYKYTYNEEVKSVKVRVFVYGDIVFRYGDDVLGATKAIGYKEAFASNDFTYGVTANDSFGTPLTVSVNNDSDTFDAKKPGNYVVTYVAKDAIDQEQELTVTYTVTNDKELTAANGEVNYQDESVTIAVTLDGVTDAFIMENGEIVNPDNYSLTETTLTMSSEYFFETAVGDVNFMLCSEYGVAEFKITVKDTGIPVFSLDDAKKDSTIKAGNNVYLPLPEKGIPLHSDYTYACTLTAGSAEYKAEVTADGIKLTDAEGNALKSGSYKLTVTAKNGEKTATKSVFVRIYDEAKETPMAFTVSAGGGREYTDYETDERIVKQYRIYDLSVSGVVDYGRLQYSIPDYTTYNALTFDFMYNSTSAQTAEGLVGTHLKSQTYSSTPNVLSIIYYDANGEIVSCNALKIGEWYTAYISLLNVVDGTKNLCIYPNFGRNQTFDMYIANTFFINSVEGETELFMQYKTENDYDKVMYGKTGVDADGSTIYTFTAKESFASDTYKLGYRRPDTSKYRYIAFEFNVKESGKDGVAKIGNYNSNDYFGGISYFDENGNGVDSSSLQKGTWYTVYADLNHITSSPWFYIAGIGDNTVMKIDIKNVRYEKGVIYGEGKAAVTFSTEGNVAGTLTKKLSDGGIIDHYSSDGSSAWTGRMWFNYSSTDYKKLVVKFKAITGSDKVVGSEGNKATEMSWQVNYKADNIKYYDADGKEVAKDALKVGEVYTLIADLSSWTTTGDKTVYPTWGLNVATTIDILEAYLDTAPVVSE